MHEGGSDSYRLARDDSILSKATYSHNPQRLVLTSTAGVVYDGTDIEDGNEDLPYASRPMNYYLESKIQQEQVL